MNKVKPFFSIVIPTYNRKDIINICIDSVLSQTFENYEIIIVDNGSTDGTKDFINTNYNDFRIKYNFQKGSGSPASPRNNGINLSKSKWICFLDSDDFWHKDKLKTIHDEIIDNNKIDVVCHNEKVFYSSSSKFGKTMNYGPFCDDFYLQMLQFGNELSTSATSVKRSFLNKFSLRFNESESLFIVEDFDFWLRLARNGANFKFINRVLGYYVISNDNFISNKEIYIKNLNHLYNLHKSYLEVNNFNNEKIHKNIDVRLALLKIKFLQDNNYLFYFFKIILKNPVISLNIIFNYIRK
jgi:glycosyltransferase involved in cell wall biosynthesis